MFQQIWDLIAIPLGFIMKYCYIFVHDILNLPIAYIWALFLFTLITKILLFPLSLKQQKSSAKMAAFQPLMADVQKTYANDKKRQQEEMLKLQEEMGYNPMSGCLPLLIQFPIIFGLIEVIYKPLTYMLTVPAELVSELTSITNSLVTTSNTRLIETSIIEQIKTNIGAFSSLTANPEYADWIERIANLDMSIGSINLWDVPSLQNPSLVWLIPAFSVVTMLASSLINLRTSGSADAQGGAQSRVMMIVMSLMFAVFSFMYPAGFSLYWAFQNIILIGQSFLLKRIVDPEKLKEQMRLEMEEKKKSAKKKKKNIVKIKDEKTGEVIEKELSVAELEKLRLQKARTLKDSPYDC
ncbi:MAG: YidC/Oxa1 family membrane protein insertase [Oscillospiraceae bacterium]|nr:YidC/Oxa1 family membrane protein insertase [Oscillospiraceae bacterium]